MNLRTHLERVIGNAGHTLWPRLLQNLRASCETDWVERYPSHVVAKWLGHSPKIAAAHYLMSREHHFEDVIAGGSKGGTSSVPGDPTACDANCDSLATQIATLQGSATVRNEPHKTTEPAATIQVAAGSSVFAPVTKTGQVAGTGTEQTWFHLGKQGVESVCCAECDAISTDCIELLARAVALVAGMVIPEAAREAVLARLTADRASQNDGPTELQEDYNSAGALHGELWQPMTTVQEIEKAIEALPLAEQLRLCRYLPHLIGCAPEELDWQRLAVEEFFRDDSPDDAVYDSIEGWGSGVRTTGLKAHPRNEAIQVP